MGGWSSSGPTASCVFGLSNHFFLFKTNITLSFENNVIQIGFHCNPSGWNGCTVSGVKAQISLFVPRSDTHAHDLSALPDFLTSGRGDTPYTPSSKFIKDKISLSTCSVFTFPVFLPWLMYVLVARGLELLAVTLWWKSRGLEISQPLGVSCLRGLMEHPPHPPPRPPAPHG